MAAVPEYTMLTVDETGLPIEETTFMNGSMLSTIRVIRLLSTPAESRS